MNITSEQHLRSIIGAPHSITKKKKIDHLSDDAMAFLALSLKRMRVGVALGYGERSAVCW